MAGEWSRMENFPFFVVLAISLYKCGDREARVGEEGE